MIQRSLSTVVRYIAFLIACTLGLINVMCICGEATQIIVNRCVTGLSVITESLIWFRLVETYDNVLET